MSSEDRGDSLGISLAITKANDLPKLPSQYVALDFTERRLTSIRTAKSAEFPELATNHKPSRLNMVHAYVLDVGKATATEVAQATKIGRSHVSEILKESGHFTNVGRDGREVYYGVKANVSP